MAAQNGRAMLLKYYNGSAYVAVGGLRQPTITINNEMVDVTNADDAGIRKLLQGAGVNSVAIKAQGVYVEDAASTALRTAAATDTHTNFQLFTPGVAGKTYQGSFKITQYEEAGTYNGAVTYNLTLESAGAVTIS
jgi:TP901-1 family phage major tail protein